MVGVEQLLAVTNLPIQVVRVEVVAGQQALAGTPTELELVVPVGQGQPPPLRACQQPTRLVVRAAMVVPVAPQVHLAWLTAEMGAVAGVVKIFSIHLLVPGAQVDPAWSFCVTKARKLPLGER